MFFFDVLGNKARTPKILFKIAGEIPSKLPFDIKNKILFHAATTIFLIKECDWSANFYKMASINKMEQF